ncbi:succinylglutamate desuccinylase/aspartoacylase family protein [Roseiflexus sp.]|uniref:succinylglutamate desuccinylase/aspartoacylase family protein n=1 Tax=Roseiflexus sp. TaxID=2562120 RepID=UPI00398AE724
MRCVVAPLLDGTLLTIPLEIVCGAADGPRLAVIAGVHGDELEGVRAVQILSTTLDQHSLTGTVLLIPVANMAAFAARTRRNPLDNTDLNRVFPGRPDGTISERLAYVIVNTLLADATLVVSLHGLGALGTLMPWMEFVDIPGSIGRASHTAALAFGFADLMPLPLLPGVLIAALAQRDIPAIEGEIGGMGTVDPANWQRYVIGVMRVMRHLMMIPNSPAYVEKPGYWELHWVHAPSGGLFDRRFALGDKVVYNQQLGVMFDPFGEPVDSVVAPCDGLAGACQTIASVHPGDPVALIWSPSQPRYVA